MKLTPQDWIDEIDRALVYRRGFAKEERWREIEANYLHSPASSAALGPNLIFEMGDTLLSATGALDPEFTVVPEHPASVQRAPFVEAVDNLLARKMKLRKQVNRASLHSYLYNRAIIKIGYDSEFGWNPLLDVGSRQQPLGMSLSQFDLDGYRIENKDVQPGMPWAAAVLPHDIAVPWGTIDIEDAPWVAHRIIRLNTSIKKDRKYKNTSSLNANMSIEDFVASYLNVGGERTRSYSKVANKATGPERPQAIYNELWEIHDRQSMTVKVVCRDHKKFLRDERDVIMSACGMPFVSGTLVDHPRSFWSTPLAYYLMQLQDEKFDIARQQTKQRRISVLKFLVAKGLIQPEKLSKLISGDVGAVEFTELPEDIQGKIMPFPMGNLYDFTMQTNQVRQDSRSMIGFSRNQTGEFDVGTRRTKGEAMLVAQGSMRREGPRTQMVRDLYLETMAKVNQIIFSFWTRPRQIQVGREWGQFTGQEIKGDYLYDLSLSAKRDLSKAERKVEALMVLSQLGPMLQGIDPNNIFEFLNNAANDPAFERLLGLSAGQKQQSQQQGAQ